MNLEHEEKTMTTKAYAAIAADSPLAPFGLTRRSLAADDVRIDILYCGVCHSDLHTARNEWRNTLYPCVPGHEIVGRVRAVGAAVQNFKVGDLVGVGCMSQRWLPKRLKMSGQSISGSG